MNVQQIIKPGFRLFCFLPGPQFRYHLSACLPGNMRTPDSERSAVVYDIWKKIDNSPDPEEPPRSSRWLTWVKARSFPYYLTKAEAQAELAQVLTAKDTAAKNHYKIVRHEITARMLEQDIACGKVALA